MAAFRFRAAAALDLRREQERAAGVALGRSEARFHEAERAAADAAQARRDAEGSLMSTERQGTDQATLVWHRNWIARLAAAADTLAREREHAADETREARRRFYEARQRRLALERLRDRAWHRHQQQELQQELKVIDELARLRFVMPGTSREDM
jgi:flagellar export protein FliJ